MGPLYYAAKFDPFLSLYCASVEGVGRNPRKERDQILPSGNLVRTRYSLRGARLAFEKINFAGGGGGGRDEEAKQARSDPGGHRMMNGDAFKILDQ